MKDELDLPTLARARRGDPRAFRALYEHHADVVYAFLYRMLGSRSAAEDALQDTFVRVLEALRRFDPAGPARLSTWILCIARRLALNVIARQRTIREHAALQTAAAISPGSGPPAGGPELRLTLEAAIAELPATLRSTFVLREASALSYQEIAELESVDVGTVKSRLHRARAALSAWLGADAGVPTPSAATASASATVTERSHSDAIRASR